MAAARAVACLAALLLIGVSCAGAAVIYRENFANAALSGWNTTYLFSGTPPPPVYRALSRMRSKLPYGGRREGQQRLDL